MNFFHLVRDIGLEAVKKRYSSNAFYTNVRSLTDAGLSKAWLQNLHTESKGKVIPLVRFVEVNFDAQTPENYIPPVTHYQNVA